MNKMINESGSVDPSDTIYVMRNKGKGRIAVS